MLRVADVTVMPSRTTRSDEPSGLTVVWIFTPGMEGTFRLARDTGEMHCARDDIAEAKQIEGALVRDHGNVLPNSEPRGEDVLPG